MAKCFKTIYFEADLMLQAEQEGIDLNQMCNDALRIRLNLKNTQGTLEGDFANDLRIKQERATNIKTLKRMFKNHDKNYNLALHKFSEAYDTDLNSVLKLVLS